MIALNIQWLVGGIVVTEYVFGYPGIGAGARARRWPRATSRSSRPSALLVAVVYISLNVVADMLVVLLIPKLRTAQ